MIYVVPPSSQKSLESRQQTFMPAIIFTNTTVVDDDDNDGNSNHPKGAEFRMRRQSDRRFLQWRRIPHARVGGSIKHRIRGCTSLLLLPPVYNVRTPTMMMVVVVADNRYFPFSFTELHPLPIFLVSTTVREPFCISDSASLSLTFQIAW